MKPFHVAWLYIINNNIFSRVLEMHINALS